MRVATVDGEDVNLPIARIIGVIGLLLILVFVGSFVWSWANAAKDVVSPGNVRAQFHNAYSNYEALGAEACTVARQREVVAAEANPDFRIQLQSQLLSEEQTYRNIAAQYNAAYDNAFEAKHVGPRDLPARAPVMEDMIHDRCPS